MSMVIQNNLNAINANNKLASNVSGTKKSTEKLSSGFRINRAADDAAGLAISEKMRAQLKGLGQAIRNANDGISLIQTAEGALDETHAMLKRLKELAVQAGNDTYSAEERAYMQDEIENIKTEIDRIAKATDFNGIKLLDGSLSGGAGSINSLGARYGALYNPDSADGLTGTSITSSVGGVTVNLAVGASGKGGEFANWDAAGTELTITLNSGTTYTQAQIDELIAKAATQKDDAQEGAAPKVAVKLSTGVVTITEDVELGTTEAGVRATSGAIDLTDLFVGDSQEGYADSINFIANSYGVDERKFTITVAASGTDGGVAPGKEWVATTTADSSSFDKDGEFVLHLATGYNYSATDIQNILAKAGFDYTIELGVKDGTLAPDGDVFFRATNAGTADVELGGGDGVVGAGLGNQYTEASGQGLTFQIGANNAVEQRVTLHVGAMDSSSIGIANIDVTSIESALVAMDSVEKAIIAVSSQRSALGAMQNRLEYTVNSLTVTTENLTAAESQIRDTDMAGEMVEYTKFSILQQAAQAMLAQANQAPQAILQLLR